MHALKIKPGSTVSWRSIEWKVVSADKDSYELRAKRPEIAAIVGPIKFKKEIPLPSVPVVKEESQELVLPDSLEPKHWDPTALRWKLLAEARFQNTKLNNLLWSSAVPINQLNRQLLPTHRALEQKTPRILIADDVGLGKTTEAGLLISELLARSLAQRVLVIAPAHLAYRKWERELNKRFGLCFSRVDSTSFLNIHENKLLSSDENPFQHIDRLILSLDYAKEPHICRKLEEADWDLIVFDECHRIAKRSETERGSALRYRLASRLASKTKGLVLISGTPHDGDDNSFESLIELLSRKSEVLPNPPEPILIRRLRKEIDKSEALLSPEPEFASFEPSKEWLRVSELLSTFLLGLKSKNIVGSDLFQVTAFKRFLSSPYALMTTLGIRTKNPNEEEEEKESNHSDEDLRTHLIAEDAKEEPFLKKQLEALEDALQKLIKNDPKCNWLGSFVINIPKDDRVIIFTEFADTAETIKIYLESNNQIKRPIHMVTGSDQKKITKTLENFAKKKGSILITTDTLSEGVDLQENCHRLLHYDLPFRPYRIEQRNGRIDRMGQKNKPHITMLVPNEKKLSEAKSDFVTIKALGVSRLYEHLSRQKAQLGSIVPVLESLKSLQGKSEKKLFLDLDAAIKEVENFKLPPQDETSPVSHITIGKQKYLRDRRASAPDLQWTGQSDLGAYPKLIARVTPLFDFLSTFLREGTGLPISISENGVLANNALPGLYQSIYPTVKESALEKISEWTLPIFKDCVNEENTECLTWGHMIWDDFAASIHYAFGEGCNVALSPLKSDFPVIISCWKTNLGILVKAVVQSKDTWKSISENEARNMLGEEFSQLGSGSSKRVTPKSSDKNCIIDAYSQLRTSVLAENPSAEFIGLIFRQEGGAK